MIGVKFTCYHNLSRLCLVKVITHFKVIRREVGNMIICDDDKNNMKNIKLRVELKKMVKSKSIRKF